MKYIILILFMLIISGCKTTTKYDKVKFDPLKYKLIGTRNSVTVDESILDDLTVHLPVKSILIHKTYSDNNPEIYQLDARGRVINNQGIPKYHDMINHRYDSFEETPVIEPLIYDMEIDGCYATQKIYDQLGRELKIEPL